VILRNSMTNGIFIRIHSVDCGVLEVWRCTVFEFFNISVCV
jgi:hypothetical protein